MSKANQNIPEWRGGLIGCLARLVLGRRVDWTEHQLITSGGILYIVRDAEGMEREIKNPRTGQWAKESQTTFSSVPHWENYHKSEYKDAIPFENDQADPQSPDL